MSASFRSPPPREVSDRQRALRHGLDLESEATAVESAVERALEQGLRTPDLGGGAGTAEATQAVLAHL